MRFAGFLLDGAARTFRHQGVISKLLVVLAASKGFASLFGSVKIQYSLVFIFYHLISTSCSGGGIVAYADARTDAAAESAQIASKKKVVVLGTGWGGTTFLKNLDSSLYDVQVISPRNYFAFTPLLPSVTCGTVEPRSIIEPVRRIIRKSKYIQHPGCGGALPFPEGNFSPSFVPVEDADCSGVYYCANFEFLPFILEIEVEDAQKIRGSVIDCFERATLPDIDEEERKRILHFVIVGAGPTGVEFAAELHDFFAEDLAKLYPTVKDLVNITVIGHAEHILTMFDKRISTFAEQKFQRDGIELKTGFKVVKVSDKTLTMQNGIHQQFSVPYGMAVWSTGIGAHPFILEFMKQIGQGNRRALATNEWLRVRECTDVYAIGDCATIAQSKIMVYAFLLLIPWAILLEACTNIRFSVILTNITLDFRLCYNHEEPQTSRISNLLLSYDDILEIFRFADKDNSGSLTMKEIEDVLEDICAKYPQVELYLKSNHMSNIVDLIKASKDADKMESEGINIEEFKIALANVDSQVKSLPATAQGKPNFGLIEWNRKSHIDLEAIQKPLSYSLWAAYEQQPSVRASKSEADRLGRRLPVGIRTEAVLPSRQGLLHTNWGGTTTKLNTNSGCPPLAKTKTTGDISKETPPASFFKRLIFAKMQNGEPRASVLTVMSATPRVTSVNACFGLKCLMMTGKVRKRGKWIRKFSSMLSVALYLAFKLEDKFSIEEGSDDVDTEVAAQQGIYLARCFNKRKDCEENPEGPQRIKEAGRHHFFPFRYKHFGQFAPLGGEQTAAELPGDWISIGHSTQWLWYSVYASKQVSWRTRTLVISDWARRFVFGRDSCRI
ncbi:hypothetical protein ZIOFF_014776 [Zingiber officinale]|uniref:NADH:ubiquinone reductase (non-electrogenic) n=1 Tax=Zingiber officinale TaxID=94328 RepID=A0A8J5HHU4_ZINOF|nr:hypothetical protein ZIOFF_014776 [Zingiber officinale]